MSFNDSKNVIVGAATLYVSATDSSTWTSAQTLPAGVAAGSGSTNSVMAGAAANWRNVGYTKDGVEVQYAPTYGEVDVDQLLDAARLFKQQLKVTVLTNMVEASLENLLVAWGQKTNAGTSSIDIAPGNLGDAPVERALVFVGGAPKNGAPSTTNIDRVYYVTRAIVDQSTNHMLRKTEATTFPVAFRLLPDTTQSNNRYGTIVDRTWT